MTNNPLTEKDFESMDLWNIYLEQALEKKQYFNPLLCDWNKVVSAKRLLKQYLQEDFEMGTISDRMREMICKDVDACFQIPDGDINK